MSTESFTKSKENLIEAISKMESIPLEMHEKFKERCRWIVYESILSWMIHVAKNVDALPKLTPDEIQKFVTDFAYDFIEKTDPMRNK